MIITKKMPYSEIKKKLKKSDRISILSCNSCARICNTGGGDNLNKLKTQLEKDGFEVCDALIVAVPCNSDMVKNERKNITGNVILCQACDAAVYNLKKDFPKKK
ncbi:MAG: hypothetical protein PHI86_06760, partial [Candidatus Omnitrophica bacterium]|nr:hypothetical protein [Candidatus Omnitrophota bacterium]